MMVKNLMIIKLFVLFLFFNLSSINAQETNYRSPSIDTPSNENECIEKITTLIISEFDFFPDTILQFKNLERLILNDCHFDFPKKIKQLHNIKTVHIENCNHFPKGIEKLKNLKLLIFSDNTFEKIPEKSINNLKLNKIIVNNLYNQGDNISIDIGKIKSDTLSLAFLNSNEKLNKILKYNTSKVIELNYCLFSKIPKVFKTKKINTLVITGSFISSQKNECSILCELSMIKTVILRKFNFDQNCLLKLNHCSNIKVENCISNN